MTVFTRKLQDDRRCRRDSERLELDFPTEIIDAAGNRFSGEMRDLGFNGIGLIHPSEIAPGKVTVNVMAQRQPHSFSVDLLWCKCTEMGTYISGGCFSNDSTSVIS